MAYICKAFKLLKFIIILLFLSNVSYSQSIFIGQRFQGGIVFFIDSTNSHGLIVQDNDEIHEDGAIWLNAISNCTKVSSGGYNDWKLPNAKELFLLYKANRSLNLNLEYIYSIPMYDSLGNMYVNKKNSDKTYWRTSVKNNMAETLSFQTGKFEMIPLKYECYYRAIRSF